MSIKQAIEKYRVYIFGVCIFMVFLTILIYNILTPYLGDDIIYKIEVMQADNLFDLVRQQYLEYLGHNGRVVGQFNLRLSLAGSKTGFNVVNSVMFVLLTLCIYWNIEERKRHDFVLYGLIVLVVWRYSVDFGETILWLCGACNYLWNTVIILGLATFYHHLLKKRQLKYKFFSTVGLFLWGIIAGWCNENTSGGGLLLILLFTITAFIEKRRESRITVREFLQPYMAATHLGMMCGIVGMVLSPGSLGRLETAKTEESYSGILGYLSNLYKCLDQINELFLELLIILGCTMIIAVVYKKKGQDVLIKVIPFIIAFAATALVLILIPTPTSRAYFGAGVFLMIACIETFFLVFRDNDFSKIFQSIFYCAVWVLFISFFFIYIENLINLARIYREEQERNALIEEAIESGEPQAVVPKYREEFRTPFSMAHDVDLSEDHEYWINYYYEVYYEIGTIYALPREEWEAQYQ